MVSPLNHINHRLNNEAVIDNHSDLFLGDFDHYDLASSALGTTTVKMPFSSSACTFDESSGVGRVNTGGTSRWGIPPADSFRFLHGLPSIRQKW